jgi:hypothetical protein
MTDAGSVLLERVSLLTPMAIRFWDQATRSFVRDGLDVKVRPATGAGRAVPAIPNRSGVFVARGLPGMREPESGTGDAAFWESLPSDQVRPFLIATDAWGAAAVEPRATARAGCGDGASGD